MGRQFEAEERVEVPATPEQVWEAIATGPGIDSWFMGNNEVTPGESVRMAFGGYTPSHTVTAWEEGTRLAYGGDREPDGRYIAYEFLIEGRAGGSTVLRMVTSGFLPGDDWADEFEAMQAGGAMFFATLTAYLTHFAGRTATPVTVFGPEIPDWDKGWAALHAELGLDGDRARIQLDGSTVDGVVYFTNAQTLGIRTPDALYRFFRGFQGGMVAMHHLFSDASPSGTSHADRAWQRWLDRVFS